MGASGGGEGESSSDAGKNTVYIAAGIGTGAFGCLIAPLLFLLLLAGTIVVCALGWIFWPIVLLCEIGILDCDGGGGGGGSAVDTDQVVAAFNSDGKGALKEGAVPVDYLSRIQDAGVECKQIGAIVIVSQIQLESQFNPKLVGPDGKEGISQLPPDKFKEFGKDDDDNDKTSALDAADSIMAQGRYMCSLAKEIDTLIANNEVAGNSLDMTLAAYTVGLDAVKQAKGVPKTDKAQSYVIGVRSSFALYSESVDLGDDEEYPSLSPRPTPSTT
ncbi:transglycosylase SLT domain-containing protein [Streptomyces sp. NPDC093544]|uniref:transglycosylase SLT domain-containing protein n=1 Tax=Streptomyces sp. NPDC093544 TaxID=3155200 RepID=UPI0034493737